MPRKSRILPPSGMFHIISRSNNNVSLFRNRYDYERFIETIKRFTLNDELFIQNYALMRNHIHLLAWVDETKHLAETLKAILISYQYWYSKKYNYKGHLFRDRYKTKLITSDEQWLQCARYIELNPVHASICSDPKDYRWSSYKHYAYGKNDPLVRIKMLMPGFDETENGYNKKYIDFVRDGIDMDYQMLKKMCEA